MSKTTKNLGLFEYEKNADGTSTFNIEQALNGNWDKLDEEVSARVKTEELAAEVKKVVKSGGLTAADLGAEKSGAVAAHDASASAHSALFAAKQNKIKGTKGKYVGFTANDTVGEVDAPASGGSRITLTFASDFVGQAWTLKGGGETFTGTVDSSLTASVSVLGINTTYTLSCVLDGVTYTNKVATKEFYTALSVRLTTFRATINVTVDSGSTVTATLGSTVLTRTSTGTASAIDTVVFSVNNPGAWAVKATKGDQTAERTVSITENGQNMSLIMIYADVFGVCWDTSNSSTALTRLTPETDPYGLVTRSVTTEPVPAVGTGSGSSPFDAYAPWRGMKECNLGSNGSVEAWQGDSGFSRSNSYTMVFIPEFYVAAKRNGVKQYFYVSDVPVTGFTKHPGSGKYVGKYHMNSDKKSQTGRFPSVNVNRTTQRYWVGNISKRIHLYDFVTYCAVIWLYVVEFADWNSQSKIGRGCVDYQAIADNNVDDVPVKSGGTDSMTYHTGRAAGTDGKTAVQYRWIENLWGNVFQWVDGININGATAYCCTDPSKYADDTSTGYTNIGTLSSPGSGWINGLTVTDNGLLIPKMFGGSETTYIPDNMWSPSGWGALRVGGHWSLGAQAGLLCFDAYYGSSDESSIVSARLMCEG